MTSAAVRVCERSAGRAFVWFAQTWALGWDVICRGPTRYRNSGRL